MRLRYLLVACLAIAAVVPASAVAADRMLIGFQDDPSFRWRDDRATVLDLAQQADASGKPVAPKIYAKLYRAAYAGIKVGNPKALVGIGETSARGRDKPLNRPGLQETESPGRFAQLLSLERPKLKFAAWSHHPY